VGQAGPRELPGWNVLAVAPVAPRRDDCPVRAGDYRADRRIARAERGPSFRQRHLPRHRDRRQQQLSSLVTRHRAIMTAGMIAFSGIHVPVSGDWVDRYCLHG
jgi:hypothetical protein